MADSYEAFTAVFEALSSATLAAIYRELVEHSETVSTYGDKDDEIEIIQIEIADREARASSAPVED